MNLQELKQELRQNTDMTKIYSKIRSYAEDGEDQVLFNCNGDDWNEISQAQVDILREDGYTVEWNRACLWFEVGGWK